MFLLNILLSYKNKVSYKEYPTSKYGDLNIGNSNFSNLRIDYEQADGNNCNFITKLYRNTIEKDLQINAISQYRIDELLFLSGNNIGEFLRLNFFNNGEHIHQKHDISLSGGNTIRNIEVLASYPEIIDWGLKEFIGENILIHAKGRGKTKNGISDKEARELIAGNKIVLTKFRKMAIDKGDRLQENAINYHITKCDELLLQEVDGFWQEKMIMWIGKVLSRHGTSWLRPLLWIIGNNMLVGILIFLILCIQYPGDITGWGILYLPLQLFNPLVIPISIEGGIKENFNYSNIQAGSVVVAFLIILSKAFYAMCIYEFVRAARRFTIK